MSTSLQHSPARPTLVPPPSDAQVEATVRRATQFLFEFVDRYVEGSSSGAASSSLAPRRPIDPPPKRLTLAAVGRVSSQLAQMRSAVRAQAEGESFKKVVPFL